MRRYTPELIDVLQFRAIPAAQSVLDAVNILRRMNRDNLHRIPYDATTDFIKPRWKTLVFTKDGVDRRFYEICALSELKNSLRSGDIWVQGSRQFRDFDEYLMPMEKFRSLQKSGTLLVELDTDCDRYLKSRLLLLEEQLSTVARLAAAEELPDAIITESGLKISQLEAMVPEDAQTLIDRTSIMMPRIKITELLMDVDEWTGFSRHFVHLKSGAR